MNEIQNSAEAVSGSVSSGSLMRIRRDGYLKYCRRVLNAKIDTDDIEYQDYWEHLGLFIIDTNQQKVEDELENEAAQKRTKVLQEHQRQTVL